MSTTAQAIKPRPVRLSEAQAGFLVYALANGRAYATTYTNLGRNQRIRTAEALAARGLVVLAEEMPGENGYDLTDAGRAIAERRAERDEVGYAAVLAQVAENRRCVAALPSRVTPLYREGAFA
jgi:hypothetical protein